MTAARRALIEPIDQSLEALQADLARTGTYVPARRAVDAPVEYATVQLPKISTTQSAATKSALTTRSRRSRSAFVAAAAGAAILLPAMQSTLSTIPRIDNASLARAAVVSRDATRAEISEFDVEPVTAEEAARIAAEEEAARIAAEEEAARIAAEEEAARIAAEEEAARVAAEEEAAAARAAEEEAAELDAAAEAYTPARAAVPGPDAQSAPIPTVTGPASGTAMAAVNFALAQVGKPYIWGSTGPAGYDCSGLVYAAYGSAGVGIPRTSGAQMGAGPQVAYNDMQPGDIIISYGGGHSAMYIGNGQVVEALNTNTGVIVNSVPNNIVAIVRPA